MSIKFPNYVKSFPTGKKTTKAYPTRCGNENDRKVSKNKRNKTTPENSN